MIFLWAATLISVFLISLISFTGVLFFFFKKQFLERILFFLVSFATGGFLGGAFLRLIPEAVNELGLGIKFSLTLLLGLIVFFVLEKFIFWRHCHVPTSKNHPHPLVFMNLVGGSFHNFLDGVMIAASFMINFSLGITTTLAVLIHQIPQEIGDFGVLVYGGFTKKKALFLNFLSALSAMLGAILALILGSRFTNLVPLVIPFTAGAFIYIASSDLIPELKKETGVLKSLVQFFGLILGIGFMLLLTFLE